MSGEREPDHSRVFCMLPWSGMHNVPNGNVFPCCYWSGESLGSLRSATLPELLNAEPLKRLRRDMLAGRPSAGCSYCYENDKVGLPSLRADSNHRLARHLDSIKETREDGGLPRPRLRQIHLTFSNLCNLRCRTCSPRRSTAWYQDIAALMRRNYGEVPKQVPLTPLEASEDLVRILEPHLKDLHSIRLSGGEPLLIKEHYDLLELLLERGLSRVGLIYNTNLSVLRYQDKDVVSLWNRFENVEVAASFDASGRRGEYLRKGQRWAEAVDNWRRVRRDCPRAALTLAPVVSVFNALHLPDFQREWVEEGLIRVEDFGAHILRTPRHYCVQAFPRGLKEKTRERYENHISGFLGPLGSRAQPAVDAFKGILSFMMADDLSGELENFRKATADLDEVRGESFSEAFPELAELMAPSARSGA